MSSTIDSFVAILTTNKTKYRNATNAIRPYIVKEVEKDILKRADIMGKPAPEDLENEITRWFQHETSRGQKKSQTVTKRKSTFKSVVIRHHNEEIRKLASELSRTAGTSSKNEIACYSKAVSMVMDGLSEEQRTKYMEEAEEGKTKSLNVEERCRNAQKLIHKKCKAFVHQLEEEMGAKVVMLVGYKNVDGDALSASFESKMVGENGIEEPIPWPSDEDTWDKMVYDMYASKEDDEGNGLSSNVPMIDVEMDESGDPILPSTDGLKLPQMKEVVRKYVTAAYRSFTKNSQAVVPWINLTTSQEDYIDSDYLPEHVTLRDPSKLKQHEILKLLEHWTKRAESQDIALRFKHCSSSDARVSSKKVVGVKKRNGKKSKKPIDVNMFDDKIEDESPATVANTPEAREAFLKCLNPHDSYQRLVGLICPLQMVPIENGTEETKWCSWTYSKTYAPASFHTKAGFKLFKEGMHGVKGKKAMNVESQILGIGLALKNISAAIGYEPDEDLWSEEETRNCLEGSELGHMEIAECEEWIEVLIRYIMKGEGYSNVKKSATGGNKRKAKGDVVIDRGKNTGSSGEKSKRRKIGDDSAVADEQGDKGDNLGKDRNKGKDKEVEKKQDKIGLTTRSQAKASEGRSKNKSQRSQ